MASAFFTEGEEIRKVSLRGHNKVVIGRKETCDIVIASPLISGKHLEIFCENGVWKLKDLNSTNGTFVEGSQVQEYGNIEKKQIVIGKSKLFLEGNSLCMASDAEIVSHVEPMGETCAALTPNDEYPLLFHRSPRLLEEIPTGAVELQAPPSIGGKPTINWSSVVVMPILSMAIMMAVSFLAGGPAGMAIFSIPSTALSMGMAIFNYKKQCKNYEALQKERLDKYTRYLEEQAAVIETAQAKQRKVLNGVHPSAGMCLEIVSGTERRLWERRTTDADFMELRLGEGKVPCCMTCKVPQRQFAMQVESLALLPEKIRDEHVFTQGCPITLNLSKYPTCGLIGERQDCINLAKNMIIQAVTHHSYAELNVVVICNKEETKDFSFVRWLPHNVNSSGNRYIVNDAKSAAEVLAQLEGVLAERVQKEEGRKRRGKATPFYLFVCAEDTILEKHSIERYLTSNDADLSAAAIYLYDELDYLPKECEVIVEVRNGKGRYYHKNNVSQREEFGLDRVAVDAYEKFARKMAPLRIELPKGSEPLPTSVSFLQGYGVQTPKDIGLVEQWPQARPEKSMAVPVGIKHGGEPFYFDIHEKKHGPHGLVGGKTGCGKSEMVQSWILAMALKFPPEAVSFILIDFKGTGLILPFKNLPHLAGTISDLDRNIQRNLIALENELSRRKALFDVYKVKKIEEYQKLYHEGKADTSLSYLFIVIDEFAEFKSQFPDFIPVIDRVFAIGRALGVDMLLLTQKPSDVVNAKMNANTTFRWGLKMASASDSREFFLNQHADAGKITNPGRAYIQIGNDEVFEEVQSFYSGAPYNPYRDISLKRAVNIAAVDIYGNKSVYDVEKTTGFKADKAEIDAVVEYLDNYTRENNIPRARNIWTNKLAGNISLDQVLQIAFDGEKWNREQNGLSVTVGMIDDPRSQSQYPMKVNMSDLGHAAIYGAPGTGKTTFLQSFILSAALAYAPDELNLYIMDFGSGALNLFRDLPHVGGTVLSNEEEKVSKLARLLLNELAKRKKLFAASGVLSFEAYRETTGQELPYIMLIIDNFAKLRDMYPDMDDFFKELLSEAGNYGIYMVTTATTTTAIPYRLAEFIRNTIALRMLDKSHYYDIVGNTGGFEPENLPGRGLMKAKPPLEFQTAVPVAGTTETERVAGIKQLVTLMNIKWSGDRPVPIPVLPEKVVADNYTVDGLLVGLHAESVEPVTIDYTKEQFVLVSADGTGQAAGLLDGLVKQLPRKLAEAQIAVFDGAGEWEKVTTYGCKRLTQGRELEEYIQSLMPVLQERKVALEEGASVESYPIVVVLPDVKLLADSVSGETLRRLYSIVNLGKGLDVYVILCGRCEQISKLYYGGELFTTGMVDEGKALIIGGTANNHSIIKTGIPYTESNQELAADMGYVVTKGSSVKVKFVQE